ncbi:hypothetical protein [Rhodopila sp.]|uniref:hypothetical protein n=1 Tax=Rhodopila sp. TaxID=2480087 RepID=UPI003D09668B
MPGDRLLVLQAVRRRAVESARQALAACLRAEAEIAARIGLLDASARRDLAISDTWEDGHHFQEMAAIRSAARREERDMAALQLSEAATASEQARSILTATRTAAEAVDQLIAERAAASQADAARRAQHELDDIARSARRRAARPRAPTNSK